MLLHEAKIRMLKLLLLCSNCYCCVHEAPIYVWLEIAPSRHCNAATDLWNSQEATLICISELSSHLRMIHVELPPQLVSSFSTYRHDVLTPGQQGDEYLAPSITIQKWTLHCKHVEVPLR
jgi:hypothetical protein